MSRYFTIRMAAAIAVTLASAGMARAGGGELLSSDASESVETSVDAGGQVLLGPFSTTTHRCRKSSDAQGWIVDAPRHGRAYIKKSRGEIAYGEGERYAYCNDRPLTGTVVHYKPARGFTGDDTFAFVIRFRGGEVRAKRVNVHVE